MEKLLNSFSQFNRREQITILVGGVLLAFYLVWMIVISPLQNKRQSLLTTNTSAQQALGRVQLLARQVQNQMQQGGQTSGSSENISGLIDSSLRENGMSMSSLVPGASGEVRVRIDKANSESVMQWLYDLEVKHQVSIRELSITASNDPGQVAVNVRLLKP
jgi:general secretion pathway protein M